MKMFPHLMAPGQIGSMKLRNRIVHAPMSLSLGAGDGTCGETFVAYYAARAKGGAGLINIGTVSVGYPEGAVDAKQIAISDDCYIPSIRGLVEAVHQHGAKIMLQLNHNGPMAGFDRTNGKPLAVPSLPIARPSNLMAGYLPEELAELSALASKAGPPKPDPGFEVLDRMGIARIVRMFGAAAARAQRAGVDAVEIHAGHGYLLQAFLSPASNRRDDEYGGSVENRARFLIEVIKAVRAATGADFPILVKMDGVEFGRDDGVSADDVAFIARTARAAGADAITATGYGDMTQPLYHSGAHTPQQERLLVPYAEAIRNAAGGPVITAGRIEAEDADRDIAAGRYDFVAMGRKLLADPELPNRLAAGTPDAVRPCIYCYVCISQAYFRRPIRCAVNPEMGHESKPALPASHGHVAVVGGGITGMETARRLAMSGARVTLLEAGDNLGGAARAAARVYPPNASIIKWLEREVAALPIDVRLGVTAEPGLLATLGADRVIDTTQPANPIPHGAIDGSHMAALDVAAPQVVIIGGGVVGLGLAKFHAAQGAHVTIVDEAAKAGRGVALVLRWRQVEEARAAGVAFRLGVSAITIGGVGVSFKDAEGAAHEISGAVIMADQEKPRTITDAFNDAAVFAAQAAGE